MKLTTVGVALLGIAFGASPATRAFATGGTLLYVQYDQTLGLAG